MRETYSWDWVQQQSAETAALWKDCAGQKPAAGPQYSPDEQARREDAYDRELRAVELEAKKKPRTSSESLQAQERITSSFAQFSATALDLQGDAVQLLTDDFLPAGTRLARWARRFDPTLSMADIIQACRNAWTACGLQPLLGERMDLTASILGYSMLYPYTDNFLDQSDISAAEKRHFSARFRERLRGETIRAANAHETALWELVKLIEGQYERNDFPQVYDCLLAIHRAQEGSIAQVRPGERCDSSEILRLSCAKGGTSVLADACLARGWMNPVESRFAFDWGVLLQLGDDLQDVREDLLRGSVTLFSRGAASGEPLDELAKQLLCLSDRVGASMEALPGTEMFKELLRMSWRSLIVGAVADSHQFFSTTFLREMERQSPFRFAFLRSRREKMARREGLYATLFEAFLEAPDADGEDAALPVTLLATV